jgi:hypothetical protein
LLSQAPSQHDTPDSSIPIIDTLPLRRYSGGHYALNMVNLGTPNRYVNEPQVGTLTMPMTPGREIQLSARVSF